MPIPAALVNLAVGAAASKLPEILEKLTVLIRVIKEKKGKRTEIEAELLRLAESIYDAIESQKTLEARVLFLEAQQADLLQLVMWQQLPFWRRWFTPRPTELFASNAIVRHSGQAAEA